MTDKQRIGQLFEENKKLRERLDNATHLIKVLVIKHGVEVSSKKFHYYISYTDFEKVPQLSGPICSADDFQKNAKLLVVQL